MSSDTVPDCTSPYELRLTFWLLLGVSGVLAAPLVLHLAWLAYKSPSRTCYTIGAAVTIFFSVFDFTTDAAVGLTYALRSDNDHLTLDEQVQFLRMAALAFYFISMQIVYAGSIMILYAPWWEGTDYNTKGRRVVCTIILCTIQAVWSVTCFRMDFDRVNGVSLEPILPALPALILVVITIGVVLAFTFKYFQHSVSQPSSQLPCTFSGWRVAQTVWAGMRLYAYGLVWALSSVALAFGLCNSEDMLTVADLLTTLTNDSESPNVSTDQQLSMEGPDKKN